jgi:hypothetical protein
MIKPSLALLLLDWWCFVGLVDFVSRGFYVRVLGFHWMLLNDFFFDLQMVPGFWGALGSATVFAIWSLSLLFPSVRLRLGSRFRLGSHLCHRFTAKGGFYD